MVTDDVLVVVDGGGKTLVETGLLGGLEGGDIPYVGYGIVVSGWTTGVDLISLIIEDDVLLPLLVKDFSLMGVGSSSVGGTRDDGGVGLVGNVENCQGILVVSC